MTYEFAYITESGDQAYLKQVEALVTQFGGTVTNKDEWGEKSFAYRIGKASRGFYHIWTLTGDINMKDLKNRLNIEDGLIRYLFLKREV